MHNIACLNWVEINKSDKNPQSRLHGIQFNTCEVAQTICMSIVWKIGRKMAIVQQSDVGKPGSCCPSFI